MRRFGLSVSSFYGIALHSGFSKVRRNAVPCANFQSPWERDSLTAHYTNGSALGSNGSIGLRFQRLPKGDALTNSGNGVLRVVLIGEQGVEQDAHHLSVYFERADHNGPSGIVSETMTYEFASSPQRALSVRIYETNSVTHMQGRHDLRIPNPAR